MGSPIVPQVAVRFVTEDGVSVEGELRRAGDGVLRGAAVLCHADPQQGGSKDHPLLWALRGALARRGFSVLAFNFRGVMGSTGSFDGGRGETRDTAAAIGWMRAEVGDPVILIGWSFGADVALRAAIDDGRLGALALIAIPLGARRAGSRALPDGDALRAMRTPVLLLAGDRDPICPEGDLHTFGETVPSASVTVVPGADHFFARREREAASIVADFVAATTGRVKEP